MKLVVYNLIYNLYFNLKFALRSDVLIIEE